MGKALKSRKWPTNEAEEVWRASAMAGLSTALRNRGPVCPLDGTSGAAAGGYVPWTSLLKALGSLHPAKLHQAPLLWARPQASGLLPGSCLVPRRSGRTASSHFASWVMVSFCPWNNRSDPAYPLRFCFCFKSMFGGKSQVVNIRRVLSKSTYIDC